ncbi:MAG TPA: PQQ-dependent sugar dehydrogenase [Bacillota bacterium]|nr:PQQ-dependent sugar dehydrogenase [Bacillota bacterium]
MKFSKINWLYGVIVLECVGIAVLITWAYVHRQTPHTASTGTISQTQSPATPLKTPVIKLVTAGSGFAAPTAIASPSQVSDSRLFIAEQAGVVRILDHSGKTEPTPFLDISSKVLHSGEMGLLGIAFHPQFATNGYVYADYITKEQSTVVARYTAKNGVADPASEKILLKVAQPYGNHKGGNIQFGPDGYLYIPFGDGGSGGDPENRAQDKLTYLGKILRIDVNHGDPYSVPSDNPFAHEAGSKPEIWAYGVRNPWRISFDRLTGDLYIADVGQSKTEEVDFQKKGDKGGQNYGWRCFEGSGSYNSSGNCQGLQATPPVFEYAHTDGRCSITGGYVYRGSAEPALAGKYFYADYCGGQLYYAAQQTAGNWQTTQALGDTPNITTFGENSSGELFLANQQTGEILRVTDTAN